MGLHRRQHYHRTPVHPLTLAAILAVLVLGADRAVAQPLITEIFDGAGSILDTATGVAVDAAGNVYVAGWFTDNAFKITPAGVNASTDQRRNPRFTSQPPQSPAPPGVSTEHRRVPVSPHRPLRIPWRPKAAL